MRDILRHFLGGLCSTQGSEDSPTRATQAAGKKNAAAQKKKGTGLFKPVSCSAALSKITGISGKATRGTITKAVWAYIKKKGLSKGRNVGKIDGIFGGGSMFKLTSAVSTPCQNFQSRKKNTETLTWQ